MKRSQDIAWHSCLLEVVIYLHYELDSGIMVLKRQLLPRTPFENTKQHRIKDVKDLSYLRCKGYDTRPCISEKTDHIIGDVSRTLKHSQDWVFLRRSGYTSRPSKILEEYCVDVVAKDLGVYTRRVIRFDGQITSATANDQFHAASSDDDLKLRCTIILDLFFHD
jgi:hypothetical protein